MQPTHPTAHLHPPESSLEVSIGSNAPGSPTPQPEINSAVPLMQNGVESKKTPFKFLANPPLGRRDSPRVRGSVVSDPNVVVESPGVRTGSSLGQAPATVFSETPPKLSMSFNEAYNMNNNNNSTSTSTTATTACSSVAGMFVKHHHSAADEDSGLHSMHREEVTKV